MNSWTILAFSLFIYMCIWYLISILVKRNDVVDIGWGLGFILLAWLSFGLENKPSHAIMNNILISIWGLRLSWHIGTRLIKQEEDFRFYMLTIRNFRNMPEKHLSSYPFYSGERSSPNLLKMYTPTDLCTL